MIKVGCVMQPQQRLTYLVNNYKLENETSMTTKLPILEKDTKRYWLESVL